jgi:hypothetical protein
MTSPDGLTRFFDELHAAPTRRAAQDVFFGADWIFVRMSAKERERIYEQIDDIIAGKPHTD